MTMETHAGPGDPPVPQGPPPGPRDPLSGPSGPHDPPLAGPPSGPGGPQGPGRPGTGPGDGAPKDPRASRVTTVILVVALVVVVLTTGVLGTLAVLMTRDPGVPLGAPPPQRLRVPIHFAPVTGSQPGACTTPDGVPDDAGQNCYTLAAGVSVNAVRKIETVQDKSGAYSVRIAFAPAFRDQINDLTQEAVRQQLAIVAGEKVVAAPRVAQVITEDSLSIAGSFTKEQADAMVVRLTGAPGTATPVPGQSQPAPVATSPAPGQSQPAPVGTPPPTGGPVTPPATTAPTTAPTGATTAPTGAPIASANGATAAPAGNRTRDTATGPSTATSADGSERRYPSCEAAVKEGYGGPYYRGVHPQYAWYPDKDNDGIACDRE
ncbi:excalibur calcium-binding domain-containing protein [Streptosporangium sp. NBC_01639]|uniref:excalibur calcium-binding domain-containing protein n=1 Tax=Streptosporangium sp. NBC_01639 TaxID=2975948 RepID=UPI00386B6F60|nr:excalibur calcium-binding domain-containing protein [Streptosporangium sp. NBC_01639]